MELTAKKTLIIDLQNKSCDVKSLPDLHKYIGGVGLGLSLFKMFKEKDPVIFSVGPLNGFFPFASKTSVVLNDKGVIEDLYIGGPLSLRIRFAGIESIVLLGKSYEKTVLCIENTDITFKPAETDLGSLGLPGKRSTIDAHENEGDKIYLDNYFTTPEHFLENKLAEKGVKGIVITGTKTFKPKDLGRYNELYYKILDKRDALTVTENQFPSCSNCPAGCELSKVGELGGNVLIHSLVACQHAENIYSDVGIVFSCLNVLGYDYTHEDIENLPGSIEELLRELG